ncbi:MAG: hypothetical protein QHJ73_17455 [Armatimonadota bacterium]|nr:hypothetical protein [Armatimonadota bacterium]
MNPISRITRRWRHSKPKRVPILGVNGAGKTCLAWGIGRYLSDSGYGHPSVETARYFYEIDPYMLRNQPIPASVLKQPLVLHVNRIVVNRGGEVCAFPVNLVISSHDIPGGALVEVTRIFQTPVPDPLADPNVKRFFAFVQNADGLIVVVDLARRLRTREQFELLTRAEREAHLRAALAEQVAPLCRGIETTIQLNGDMRGKPFFFVFTKSDIHRLSVEEARTLIRTAYSILFNRLRHQGIDCREHCVAYAGTSRQPDGSILYRIEGVEELIADMALSLF